MAHIMCCIVQQFSLNMAGHKDDREAKNGTNDDRQKNRFFEAANAAVCVVINFSYAVTPDSRFGSMPGRSPGLRVIMRRRPSLLSQVA